MFAQGSLLIEQAQAALAIPATAVLNDAGLDYVMVIENGVVQRRAVHIGMHAANDNLVVSACPTCQGEGRVISAACPACSGEGRKEISEVLEVNKLSNAITRAPALVNFSTN